jgi:Helix-turn-helix domain
MTRGVEHPLELRAQVVATVLAGTSIAAAARQFGLAKQTVSAWVQAGDVPLVRTEKTLTDLILEYLQTGFRAMIVQAQVYADEHYCRTQNASDLAIAHGVLGDKLAGVAATAQALGLIGIPDSDDNEDTRAQLDAAGASDAEA